MQGTHTTLIAYAPTIKPAALLEAFQRNLRRRSQQALEVRVQRTGENASPDVHVLHLTVRHTVVGLGSHGLGLVATVEAYDSERGRIDIVVPLEDEGEDEMNFILLETELS